MKTGINISNLSNAEAVEAIADAFVAVVNGVMENNLDQSTLIEVLKIYKEVAPNHSIVVTGCSLQG